MVCPKFETFTVTVGEYTCINNSAAIPFVASRLYVGSSTSSYWVCNRLKVHDQLSKQPGSNKPRWCAITWWFFYSFWKTKQHGHTLVQHSNNLRILLLEKHRECNHFVHDKGVERRISILSEVIRSQVWVMPIPLRILGYL